MTLDYSALRKEFSEKTKMDNKRYGKKLKSEPNPQLSEREDSRKEFWRYLMDSYMEDLEA